MPVAENPLLRVGQIRDRFSGKAQASARAVVETEGKPEKRIADDGAISVTSLLPFRTHAPGIGDRRQYTTGKPPVFL